MRDVDTGYLGSVAVVIAEPGGGKSAFVRALSSSTQSQLFTATAFASWGPETAEELQNRLVIVDGLDEVAGKNWGDGVDRVLGRLGDIGCPKVVITCRAAEWDGARNRALIRDLYGEDPVESRFAPFSQNELAALVRCFDAEIDAEHFLEEASKRDLDEMLGNPESLRLLLGSVKGGTWPRTRTELFRQAVENATQETNELHTTQTNVSTQQLLQAGGKLFASILLSDLDGVDTVANAVPGFQRLADFECDDPETQRAAASTRLFRTESGTRLMPSHRMVAEFVGARWLAEELSGQKLSLTRLTAVIAPDGYVRTDLRGLHAWLATLGPPEFRNKAIIRDPYGVLRYGDPTHFSLSEKRQLLRQLQSLAEDDPYFMAAEGWTRPLIAGFFEPAMRNDVMAVLTDPERHYHLSSLVLGAMQGTGFAVSVQDELLEIVLSDTRVYDERSDAALALSHIPDIDFANLVNTLRKRRTEDSARLSLEIVSDDRREKLGPTLIADTIADATLLHSEDDNADLLMLDYSAVRELPPSLLDPVLDRLSERVRHMCAGSRRHYCGCLRALSPPLLRLMDRRFSEFDQQPSIEQLYRWLSPLYVSSYSKRKVSTLNAALAANDQLRRGFQGRALRDPHFEENPWMALCRLAEDVDGLRPTSADLAYHMEEIIRADLSEQRIELWTDLARWGTQTEEIQTVAQRHSRQKAELARKWMDITRPRKISAVERRHRVKQEQRKLREQARRQQRHKDFKNVREQIQSGNHTRWLIQIAGAYMRHFSDVRGETPEERVTDLVGAENAETAIAGLCAAIRRNDQPTLEDVVRTSCEGKYMNWELVMCAGILSTLRGGKPISEIAIPVLEAAWASNFFAESVFEEAREDVEMLIFATEERKESLLRRACEPGLALGRRHVDKLHLMTFDDHFSSCAGQLGIEWLQKYPKTLVYARNQLLQAAILFGDRQELKELIRQRCDFFDQAEHDGKLQTTDPNERRLWITAAFLLDLEHHRSMVSAYAIEARGRVWSFREISAPDIVRRKGEVNLPWPRLTVEQNRFLLKAFAPVWPRADRPRGGSQGSKNPWNAGDFLSQCAQTIANSDEPCAGEALDWLIEDPRLKHYHAELRHLRAGWRRRVRDATLEVPTFGAVRDILRSGPPKSVSDLQAMMHDALDWLQDDLRNGDTKGWAQFWNGPKPYDEDYCRNRALDRLRPRFTPHNVTLRREGSMPDDGRADIVASLILDGNEHDLPVETKGQWHTELWTATVTQLDQRYARYVNARYRGFYLVFWFGSVSGKNLPQRADGTSRPNSPKQLSELLYADLPDELKHRISIFVLDVTDPTHPS